MAKGTKPVPANKNQISMRGDGSAAPAEVATTEATKPAVTPKIARLTKTLVPKLVLVLVLVLTVVCI